VSYLPAWGSWPGWGEASASTMSWLVEGRAALALTRAASAAAWTPLSSQQCQVHPSGLVLWRGRRHHHCCHQLLLLLACVLQSLLPYVPTWLSGATPCHEHQTAIATTAAKTEGVGNRKPLRAPGLLAAVRVASFLAAVMASSFLAAGTQQLLLSRC